MRFSGVTLIMLLACCASVLAQDPGTPAGPNGVATVSLPAPPENLQPSFELVSNSDAREQAQAFVDQQGWKVGWDPAKSWGVWIGSSSLLAEDATGLAVSLQGAQLDAKFQFAEYLAPVIASAALSTLEKNPAQIKAERERMDAATRREGGDPVAAAVRDLLASGSKTVSEDPSIDRRSRVSTASRTAAQSAIPGMMVARTFVRTDASGLNGTVAVVMISTPKSRAIADSMLRGEPVAAGSPDPARTLKAFVDSLSGETLVYGAGAGHRLNEKGELCALGYGVAGVDGNDPEDLRLAEQEATQAANAELRNLAGEMVMGNRLLSRVAERTRWVDGKQQAESFKGLQAMVGTFAMGLKMPGIVTVTSKRFRHPMMGDLVCVVRSWNLSDAKAAADLRAQFEQQAGWRGGDGVQPGNGAATGANPPPARQRGVPSGQGGAPIDDP